MDEKGRALQGRLDFSERNIKTLENGVKNLLKSHQGNFIKKKGSKICREFYGHQSNIINTTLDGSKATLDLSERVRDTAAQVNLYYADIS